MRLVLRITARVSFVLFSGAFAGSSLQLLWPSPVTNWLSQKRDHWLVGFAASHTVHLAAIIALLSQMRIFPRNGIYTLVGGGLVFLLIYALAAAALARLTAKRQLPVLASEGFERFAMYTIWLVFALAFVPRSFSGGPIYAVLGLAAISVLAVRIAANRAGRKRKAAAA